MKKIFFIFILFSLAILSARTPLLPQEKKFPDHKLCGIYISIWTMNSPQRCLPLLKNTKDAGLNTVVCDFEGSNAAYLKNFNYAGELGLYRIARIVVYEEGYGANYQTAEDPANWNKKLALSKEAENLGFEEIQYDYIRFSDRGSPDEHKKEIIEKFLKEASTTLNVPTGVDVFGSVAYQPHHIIGQDLARMATYTEAVSPMLYPSHFYGDRLRMGNPYRTMLEGSTLALNKLTRGQTRLIPYIQGFPMNMSYANMNLYTYIKEQIRACEDAGTDGFFVWNAGNEYATTFAVLRDYGQLYQRPPKTREEIYAYLGISANATLY